MSGVSDIRCTGWCKKPSTTAFVAEVAWVNRPYMILHNAIDCRRGRILALNHTVLRRPA